MYGFLPIYKYFIMKKRNMLEEGYYYNIFFIGSERRWIN